MSLVPRIIESLNNLRSNRKEQLLAIFSSIALNGRHIQVLDKSASGGLIYGLSDGHNHSHNYRDWRFKTPCDIINANYHEIWSNMGKDKYFLNRSYFHLYIVNAEEERELEYILLHCDACEPEDTRHSIYKQSPHLHIELAEDPIPKAHFALYNGRLQSVLKSLSSFNLALKDSVTMLEDQVVKLHMNSI